MAREWGMAREQVRGRGKGTSEGCDKGTSEGAWQGNK